MNLEFKQFAASMGHKAMDLETTSPGEREYITSSIGQFNQIASIRAAQHNPNISIVSGILDDDDFNAFAFTDADVIGVNRGLFRGLLMLFKETVEAGAIPWIGASELAPAAMWLREAGKHFFFFHELGHIWNGHTRLLKSRGINALQEINALPVDGLSSLDLQTLEMDADGFAVANAFHAAVNRTPFPFDNVEINRTYGPKGTSLVMLAMAIYLVFSKFDSESDMGDPETWDHPPAPLRQFLITRILISHSIKTATFSEKQASELSYSGASYAEAIFSKVFLNKSGSSALGLAFGVVGEKYSKTLLRHWAELYPQLNILKPGGVLPLPQAVIDD